MAKVTNKCLVFKRVKITDVCLEAALSAELFPADIASQTPRNQHVLTIYK